MRTADKTTSSSTALVTGATSAGVVRASASKDWAAGTMMIEDDGDRGLEIEDDALRICVQ